MHNLCWKKNFLGWFKFLIYICSCKVDLAYYQKKGRKFQLLQKKETYEWCEFLTEKKTMLESILFGVIRYLFPEFCKECPISGHFEFTNLKIKKQYIKLANDGIYRLTAKLTDAERFNHAYLDVVFRIEDWRKEKKKSPEI